MKIVKKDNFDRETKCEELIAQNVNEWWGKHIVNLLNLAEHESSENFFTLEEDNYKLYEWKP